MNSCKIHKDDKVMVLVGKDRGKVGKVLKVLPKKSKVLVEGLNMVKRHVKANPYKQEQGGIVEKEAPVHISNVAIICDACTKQTRVAYRVTDEGKKFRVCKKCNEIMK